MSQEIGMPKLGDTMEEGTVVRWLVSEGDLVRRGQMIMEISTDKVVMEVESFVEGKVLRILVQAGTTVPIGTVLAYVGSAKETVENDGSKLP